jgi:quercetin dioxygenase-like cupin family protein
MNHMKMSVRQTSVLALATLFLAVIVLHAAGTSAPTPKVVLLESSGTDYVPVLSGPPESINMRSGLVVLAPGKSVGKHSTEQNEELLVVLEGQGEMTFRDGSKLLVKAQSALYCPPETEHNVTNTGIGPLRYVYVVAGTQ